MTTVGLPDSAERESRERVRTAIRNAGFAFPADRITVNLAPVRGTLAVGLACNLYCCSHGRMTCCHLSRNMASQSITFATLADRPLSA